MAERSIGAKLRTALEDKGWSYTRLIAEMRKVAARQGKSLPSTASLIAMLSTPAGLRDLAGQGVVGARERPPLIIRRCENNQRSDGGRGPQHRPHPLAGRPPGVAGSHRRPVRPGGTPAASQRVRAWPAGRPTTQELLDHQRARRGSQPRWYAAPAQPGGLGCRRGA